MLDLSELQNTTTVFFSGLAGLVALLGIIASIKATLAIKQEAAQIRNADDKLVTDESWQGAYQPDKQGLLNWLRELDIRQNSGVGDVIRACWAAFQGNRSVSLTEIHVLVARRERAKWEVKLSSGIMGLLLIVGIVGTLFAIHPVLTEFRFSISNPEGDDALVNVADSTEVVNSLMRNLGNAFLPSLWALCGTIIVATVRGFYSSALNQYTLDLDNFAIWTVIPRYRPTSISEEYDIVRTSLDSLTRTLTDRDSKFDALLEGLSKFVSTTEKTLGGLEKSIVRINDAAESLTNRTGAIGESLVRTLGKRSPLLEVITGYEDIFKSANEQIKALSVGVDAFIKSNQKGGKTLEISANKFADSIRTTAETHHEDRKLLAKLLSDIVRERDVERTSLLLAAEKMTTDQHNAKMAVDDAVVSMSEMTDALPLRLVAGTNQTLSREFKELRGLMEEFLKESTDKVAKNSEDTKNEITRLHSQTQNLVSDNTKKVFDLISQLPQSIASRLADDREKTGAKIDNHSVEVIEALPPRPHLVNPPRHPFPPQWIPKPPSPPPLPND